MTAFYALNLRHVVLGTVEAKDSSEAKRLATLKYPSAARVVKAEGMTPDEASQYIREQIED